MSFISNIDLFEVPKWTAAAPIDKARLWAIDGAVVEENIAGWNYYVGCLLIVGGLNS